MACCPSAGASSTSSTHAHGACIINSVDDDGIEFEKRSSNLPSIFANDTSYNEHRVTLDDWTKQYEASERHVARKQANLRSALSDLYQILGLFFVFQGVIITAVAQANQLTCYNWELPFCLCLLCTIGAFGACLQKLMEISEFREQHRLERAHYASLYRSIEKLKREGVLFDVRAGQPELKGSYTEAEIEGNGSVENLRSSVLHFCSMWIFSYAGAVLLLLCLFSALTLFSVHQILCHPHS